MSEYIQLDELELMQFNFNDTKDCYIKNLPKEISTLFSIPLDLLIGDEELREEYNPFQGLEI